MSRRRWAEIVIVGNEILSGHVLDTNSRWLSQRLIRMGVSVRRHVTVPDCENAIASEVSAALSRSPDLLITAGGLGPTDDDRTLMGVANALGRPLVRNETALSLVLQRYRQLYQEGAVDSPDMTPAREKMTILPDGAIPLPNTVGTAPGVWIVSGPTAIVCLPGVPAELKDIFINALPALLRAHLGVGYYAERHYEVICKDESVLAPIIKEVVQAHPGVYLKSRVRPFGTAFRIRLLLSCVSESPFEADESLRRTVDDLILRLEPAGILLIPACGEEE